MCCAVTKGTLGRKNNSEFSITCHRGYSTSHLDTEIRSLAQFLTGLFLTLLITMHSEK